MSDFPRGICRLSVVPIRDRPDYESNMVSQILFGEHYSVIANDANGEWLQIELYFDKFQGWIPSNQHFSITEDYYKQINLSDYKVCTDLSNTIFFQKKYVNILVGSILPITTNEMFKLEEQIAYNGDSKSLTQRREFEFLKDQLKKYIYAPYLSGGKTPFGVDVSGFIQQIFKLCGYRLPRTLDSQSTYGNEVTSLDQMVLGDVVFLGGGQLQTALIYLGKGGYIGMIAGSIKTISDLSSISHEVVIRRVLRENN